MRKYLEEIGIEIKNTPWGWNENDSRQEQWQQERSTYGFDERETWSLDSTFFYWLYERLKMYNEINCINTNFHKFNVNGEELTQQECIDKMLFGCKYFITKGSKNEETAFEVGKEVLAIWKECIFSMWW